MRSVVPRGELDYDTPVQIWLCLSSSDEEVAFLIHLRVGLSVMTRSDWLMLDGGGDGYDQDDFTCLDLARRDTTDLRRLDRDCSVGDGAVLVVA